MQVKKQQLEPDMEQQTGSKLGKEYVTAVYCHPAYIWNAWLDADDSTIMAESEEELKSLLMTVKEESEKSGLKLKFKKWRSWFSSVQSLSRVWLFATKIMVSGPITLWQIDGETMETVTDFIFLDSKNHYRWWLPWNLKTVAPWKKSYDQPR